MEKKINLSEQPDVVCENCGNRFFREVNMIKRVSWESKDLEETFVPFPTYCCNNCDHVNEEFITFFSKI